MQQNAYQRYKSIKRCDFRNYVSKCIDTKYTWIIPTRITDYTNTDYTTICEETRQKKYFRLRTSEH